MTRFAYNNAKSLHALVVALLEQLRQRRRFTATNTINERVHSDNYSFVIDALADEEGT